MNTVPHVSKATGVYLNSMLAVLEATRAGYDEAILLTDHGHIADGSGENVFIVRDGVVWVGAGTSRHMAGLPAAELLRVTRGELVEVAADT